MITREFRETLPRLALGDRSNKGGSSRYSGPVDKSTVYRCEGRTNDLIDIDSRKAGKGSSISILCRASGGGRQTRFPSNRVGPSASERILGSNDAVAPRRGAGNSRCPSVRCEGQLTIRTLRYWITVDPIDTFPTVLITL